MQRSVAQEQQGKRLLTSQVDEIERERQTLLSELESARECNSQLEAVAASLRVHSHRDSVFMQETQQQQLLVQSEQRALQRQSTKLQAEARQLTQVRDELTTEVGALREALGGASFERDVTSQQLAQHEQGTG